MEIYENILLDVRSKLSEKRFNHSLRVVSRALEYAQVYGVDEDIIKCVAISHDIAKELSSDEISYYINYYDIELDEVQKVNSDLLHAMIGSLMVRDLYGFNNDMVNAVRYHTTGRRGMSILEKIIFLADTTEEGKSFFSQDYINIIKEDIDRGMLLICGDILKLLINRNKIIHFDTIDCYNFYLK